jgi:hypothetical protein
MLLVNGSLLMTPLFPRSGPGESGSPLSQVILGCYDFPTRIPGRLFVSLPGSTLTSSVRVSQLALALPEVQRVPSGPGSMLNRRPNCRFALTWTWAGAPRFPGVPSRAFASFHDPGRVNVPSPLDGIADAVPALATAKTSAFRKFRGYCAASAPAAYASRVVLPPPMQSSLPAGWLAFTGRELNPLDRYKRFQITFSSPSSGFILAQCRRFLDPPYHSVRRVFPSTAGRLAFQAVPSWVIGGLSLLPAFAVRHPVCIHPSCTSWSLRWSALSRA